jgi:uncharacterized delta-60 repeat protein
MSTACTGRNKVLIVQLLCALTVLTSLLLGMPSAARAAAGDLDPSFGTDGLVTTDFGSRGDFGLAAAIQQDGKIVAAGNSSAPGVFAVDFALSRYSSDGSLDPTFGSGGTVLSDFGAPLDAAFDVLVQPDSRIVAAGISGSDFAVARYNPSGSLDPTFGTGGLVTIDFGASDQATALILQADGKLVAAGFTQVSATFATEWALVRLNPDGSLDTTFGAGGKVTTDFGSFDVAFDVVLTADAKILVTGRTGNDFALARYNASGALDSGFGIGGKVTTDLGGSDQPFAIALDSAGRAIVAGTTSGDFALARYSQNGSLDAGFGVGGTVTTDFDAGSEETAFGVVVHPDGGITTAGGTSAGPGSSTFALARYDSSGNLDPAFGAGGKVTTSFGQPLSNAQDLVLQGDGKVVALGGTVDPAAGTGDFALARYLGAPATITVVVDVKPDSANNVVPLVSNGFVTVAILTTASFDANTIDAASVCFGDAEDSASRDCTEKHGQGHVEDVNGDGRPDLLLHYEIAQTGIDAGDEQACLSGETHAGNAIEGCDRITTR